MESCNIEIAANGDTLLELRRPNIKFPATRGTAWEDYLPQFKALEEIGLLSSLTLSSSRSKARKPKKTRLAADDPVIGMRLSSTHLMHASEYFRRGFGERWVKNDQESVYAFNITAEEWDHEALSTVMNIIHCQTRHVPRKVTLEMLGKIAAVVDYYKCHSAVAFFAETWIQNLDHPDSLPTSYGLDFLLRLSISCVFSEREVFQKLTETFILMSRGSIHCLGLPGLPHIVSALDEARQNCIAELISGLQKVLADLHRDEDCSFECSSVLLGALSKGMHACHMLSSRAAPPYNGLSLAALMRAAAEIREPHWYTQSTTQFGFKAVPSPEKHKCTLSSRVKPIIDRVSNNCQGLKFDDYFQLD
jgi:hypothetical protein